MCVLKSSGFCVETRLEGSRCRGRKLSDECRQARMLVGTVGTVGKEAGDRRSLCPPPPPHGASSSRSKNCPWPSARLGPWVDTTVPEEDSHSPRCTSVSRYDPLAPRPGTHVSPAGSQPRCLYARSQTRSPMFPHIQARVQRLPRSLEDGV